MRHSNRIETARVRRVRLLDRCNRSLRALAGLCLWVTHKPGMVTASRRGVADCAPQRRTVGMGSHISANGPVANYANCYFICCAPVSFVASHRLIHETNHNCMPYFRARAHTHTIGVPHASSCWRLHNTTNTHAIERA